MTKRYTKQSQNRQTRLEQQIQIAETYLKQWRRKESGSGWKFKKSVQVWLLKNAYYKSRLSKKGFNRFLKYIAALRGKAARTTISQLDVLRSRYSLAADTNDSNATALLLSADGGNQDKPKKVIDRIDQVLPVLTKITAAQDAKLRLQD